ncbi:MAG: cell division protein FtsA [Kordiimonas sp.]|nr:cell division protein FtsA [Kordiimonas sp.]
MVAGRDSTIAALDIGTTKVCCFIARVEDGQEPCVIGIGHQVSQGLKAGAVVDMAETETSIRAAVDAAERMAKGEPISHIYVNVSAGQPSSRRFSVEVEAAGMEISENDIRMVLAQGQSALANEERQIIHALPTSFSIDGVRGVKNPRGMYGEKLGVEMHVISAAQSPLRNLQACVSRCHLDFAGLVLSPYASGLACLVEDERELGAVCIDMGGGTTTIAAFMQGNVIYTDVLPLGGGHVTSDIAHGLSISLENAERMKTLYGRALPHSHDEREVIDVLQMGENDRENIQTIPRSMLIAIIQPRLEEIFEIIHDRLDAAGLGEQVGRRIILTGGGSQMPAIVDLATTVLGRQVRLGRPLHVDGLADATAGPAFSTCAGLLSYAVRKPFEAHIQPVRPQIEGKWAKVSRWLKENF